MGCMGKVCILLLLYTFVLGVSQGFSLTGKEILERMDENTSYNTIIYEAEMTIISGNQKRTKSMEVKARGREDAITRFTNKEDRGTKYLKLGEDLWIYFPEENDTVKISGHMLKEGMMGSDVSYEDALEMSNRYEDYTIERKGDTQFKGRDCYVVELTAKTRDASYYRRRVFVDKETFVGIKEEMYAKSGKKLKTMEVPNPSDTIKTIGPFHIAVTLIIENELKRNSRTIFHMTSITINAPIDSSLFSKQYLTR